MTLLFTVLMVLGVMTYFSTLIFPRLAASSVTVSNLNILKSGRDVDRVFIDSANRDGTELKARSYVSVETGTYLRDVRKSAVRCDDNPSSPQTFRLVQVVSGPNRGTVGWTCGPAKAIGTGPLPAMP
jgi:hypothetical protein